MVFKDNAFFANYFKREVYFLTRGTMSRKKNKANNQFRIDRRKTHNLGSVVILTWESLLRDRQISPSTLFEQTVLQRDEKGDFVEYTSKRNKEGMRLHVIHRKYLKANTDRVYTADEISQIAGKESNKMYPRWDDFAYESYEIFLEKNRIVKGHRIIASDISKKITDNMKELIEMCAGRNKEHKA